MTSAYAALKNAVRETAPGRHCWLLTVACAEITAATFPIKCTSERTEVVGFEFVSVQREEHFGSEQLCSPRLAADDLNPVPSAALCHLENFAQFCLAVVTWLLNV